MVEFRGTEYWSGHDNDRLTIFQRTKSKLVRKCRAKYHYIGYRSLSGAPDMRMTATDEYLVVTNKDRVHLFDGKSWSQLAIGGAPTQLVKRVPPAMKR